MITLSRDPKHRTCPRHGDPAKLTCRWCAEAHAENVLRTEARLAKCSPRALKEVA